MSFELSYFFVCVDFTLLVLRDALDEISKCDVYRIVD